HRLWNSRVAYGRWPSMLFRSATWRPYWLYGGMGYTRFPFTPPQGTKPLRRGEGTAQAPPSPLRGLDNDEIRMTNVEGIPKTEAPMEGQEAMPRGFEFRHSGFFRHWSFVIRNSVRSAHFAAVLRTLT